MVSPLFDAFVETNPVSVMMRALMKYIFSSEGMNQLFQTYRERQYEQELLFSTQVDLIGLVVCTCAGYIHRFMLPIRRRQWRSRVHRRFTTMSAKLIGSSNGEKVQQKRIANRDYSASLNLRLVSRTRFYASAKQEPTLFGEAGTKKKVMSNIV